MKQLGSIKKSQQELEEKKQKLPEALKNLFREQNSYLEILQICKGNLF